MNREKHGRMNRKEHGRMNREEHGRMNKEEHRGITNFFKLWTNGRMETLNYDNNNLLFKYSVYNFTACRFFSLHADWMGSTGLEQLSTFQIKSNQIKSNYLFPSNYSSVYASIL